MKNLYLLTLLLLFSSISSQTISFDLHEINFKKSLNAKNLIRLNDKIIFTATGNYVKEHLFAHDINRKKTYLVKEFKSNNSGPFYSPSPYFTLLNDKVYFVANNTNLTTLWQTDGTVAGTKQIYSFPESNSYAYGIDVINNHLLISIGSSFYISDGTSENTKYIRTTQESIKGSHYYEGYYFFSGKDENYSSKIFLYRDGENFNLKDSETNQDLYTLNTFYGYNINRKCIIYATNSAGDKDGLWQFDPISKTATFIKEARYFNNGNIINNHLIYKSFDQFFGGTICSTDGTKEGTIRLTDVKNFVSPLDNQNFIKVIGDIAYFFPSYSENNNLIKNRLWKTDGSIKGTKPTDVVIDDYSPDLFKVFPQNKKLMIKNAGNNKYWLLNSEEQLTFMKNESLPESIEFGNKLLLPYENKINGNELFTYDFDKNLIELFFDSNFKESSAPSQIVRNKNGKLIFTATDDYSDTRKFYAINNIGEKPNLITNIPSPEANILGLPQGSLYQVGNRTYLVPDYSNNLLASTDGSFQNIKLEYIGSDYLSVNSLVTNIGDESLIFTTENYNKEIKLWNSNPNTGISNVIKILPIESLNKNSLFKHNNEIYFLALNLKNKINVWKSDGTAENTKIVNSMDILDNNLGNTKFLDTYGKDMIISNSNELWKYNNEYDKIEKFAYSTDYAKNSFIAKDSLYIYTSFDGLAKYHDLNKPPKKIIFPNNASTNSVSEIIKCGDKVIIADGPLKNRYTELFSIDIQKDTIITNITRSNFSEITYAKDIKCINNYIYFLKEGDKNLFRTAGNLNDLEKLSISIDNKEYLDGEIDMLQVFSDKLFITATTAESGKELFSSNIELPLYLSNKDTKNTFTKKKLIIYPNPTSHYIHIQGDILNNYNYQIFDISGRLVKSGIKDDKKIDISTLEKGFYIINIFDQNGNKYSEKILKN